MTGCLLFVAAVLSVVGAVAEKGSLMQWSWVLWGIGILWLIRKNALNCIRCNIAQGGGSGVSPGRCLPRLPLLAGGLSP